MCGTTEKTAAGKKADVSTEKPASDEAAKAKVPADEATWTPINVAALIVVNASLLVYLWVVVPSMQASNPWVVRCMMAYIGFLGISQLLEALGTGSGTNYGKFSADATGTEATKKSAYARMMDILAGPTLPVFISWWTMEQPAFWVPLVFEILSVMMQGVHSGNVFLVMMIVHYFQRSFVFPFLSRGRPFPVLYWFLSFVFCTVNGTMQALDLIYGGHYEGRTDPLADVKSVRAVIGFCLFAFGMYTNVQSDQILRNLRKPGERGYKIPQGGMFRFISGANLWGECVEWFGFAIACGVSPTAWLFSAFNFVGIGMRAVSTHNWYLSKFGEDYERLGRKKLIPFVW